MEPSTAFVRTNIPLHGKTSALATGHSKKVEKSDWRKSETVPSVIDSDESPDHDDSDDLFYTSIEWPIFPEGWAYVARFLLIQIIIFPHLKLYLTKILLLHDRPPRFIG